MPVHYTADRYAIKDRGSFYDRRGRAAAASAARRSTAVARRRRAPMVSRPMMKVFQQNAGELRGMDTQLEQTAIVSTASTNANVKVLNLVETGNGSWNRNGRKIFLKSVRLRGWAQLGVQTAATSYDCALPPLRMVVVWDKQPGGASIPTFDTIFGQTSQDGTETSEVFDSLKFDNTGRFSVVRDEIFSPPHVLPSDGAAAAAVNTLVPFDVFIDLKGKETIFMGDSDPVTIADISSGGLYVYFRSGFNSTDNVWTVSAASFSRLRFTC